jgi:choline dehydrogenase-like flavoprotein
MRVLDNLRNTVQPVHSRHRNQLCKDWVNSCSTAMDIPVIHDFNREIRRKGDLTEGVGFFSVSYNPDDGRRSSASVAYIHPILRGDEHRPNLTILTNSWVSKINVSGDRVTGIDLILQDECRRTLIAKTETILCAGAIDTPRLMLLSGLGPKQQLQDLSIPVVKDIPGVGENLLDHPETIIIWELNRPVPPNQTTMDSDAGIFLRREEPNAAAIATAQNPQALKDGKTADIMMHCYQIPFCLNTTRLGYDTPIDGNAFQSSFSSQTTHLTHSSILHDTQHPAAALPRPPLPDLGRPNRQTRSRLPLLHRRRRLRRRDLCLWPESRSAHRAASPLQRLDQARSRARPPHPVRRGAFRVRAARRTYGLPSSRDDEDGRCAPRSAGGSGCAVEGQGPEGCEDCRCRRLSYHDEP